MMRHDVLLIFSQPKFTRPSHPHAETYRQEVFQCYSGQMGESPCQSKIHNFFIVLTIITFLLESNSKNRSAGIDPI